MKSKIYWKLISAFVKLSIPANCLMLFFILYIRLNVLSIYNDRIESSISDSYVLYYDEMVFIKDCWQELFYYCFFYIVLCIVLSILFIKSKKEK